VVRWVSQAATEAERIVVVEVATPLIESSVFRVRSVIVVESSTETKGVIVVDIVSAVVMSSGETVEEKSDVFVGQRLLEARGRGPRGVSGLGWVRVKTAEFGIGVPGAPVQERPGGGSLVEDVDSDGVEGDGGTQPLLRGGLGVVRDMVEGSGGGGQFVGFASEKLSHGGDAALIDPFFALVAGDFFDPEHFTTEVDCAMDAGPKVSLFTFDRSLSPLEEEGEGVMNRMIVDKNVHWALSRGDEMHEGQGLSPLGSLR